MPSQQDQPGKGSSRITALLQRLRDMLSDRLLEAGQQEGPPDGTAYNVIFTGKLVLPEAEAVANIAAFFKLGQVNARRLLQAGRILKSYPDKAPADKLARLLTRAGAECRVELEVPEEASDEPGAAQKVAFALDALHIPELHVPDYRQFDRRVWVGIAAAGVLAAALALWLVLRPPVIHGDSMADYEKSIGKVAARLEPEQARQLHHAIDLLTESARNAQRDSATTDPVTAARLIYASVEGKKAVEIIAMAEARLEKQRAAYRKGLAEADGKIAAANQKLAEIAPGNAAVLDRITVEEAAFGWPTGAEGPTIVFRLRNGSDVPVIRIHMQGYLYDANGALLASNPLTYATASGIPPRLAVSAALPMPRDNPWSVQQARGQKVTLRLRVANAENRAGDALGIDYRPFENERQRQLDWKAGVQAKLDAIKL